MASSFRSLVSSASRTWNASFGGNPHATPADASAGPDSPPVDAPTQYQFYVHIVSATGLKKCSQKKPTSNPMVKVHFAGLAQARTKPIKDTLDPNYHEEFLFTSPNRTSFMLFKVVHVRTGKKSLPMGKAYLKVDLLQDGMIHEVDLDIVEGGTGKLKVIFRVDSLGDWRPVEKLGGDNAVLRMIDRVIPDKKGSRHLRNFRLYMGKHDYRPGDVVRGMVVYVCRKPMFYLELTFTGLQTSVITITKRRGDSTHITTYAAGYTFFSNPITLLGTLGSASETQPIHPHDIHVFPFEFQLPHNLPKSQTVNSGGRLAWNSSWGGVFTTTYQVQAKLKSVSKNPFFKGSKVKKIKCPLNVRAHYAPHPSVLANFSFGGGQSAKAVETAYHKAGKKKNKAKYHDDISVDLQAPSVIRAGDKIDLVVSVQNRGEKSVGVVKVLLEQYIWTVAAGTKGKWLPMVQKGLVQFWELSKSNCVEGQTVLPIPTGGTMKAVLSGQLDPKLLPTVPEQVSPLGRVVYFLKTQVMVGSILSRTKAQKDAPIFVLPPLSALNGEPELPLLNGYWPCRGFGIPRFHAAWGMNVDPSITIAQAAVPLDSAHVTRGLDPSLLQAMGGSVTIIGATTPLPPAPEDLTLGASNQPGAEGGQVAATGPNDPNANAQYQIQLGPTQGVVAMQQEQPQQQEYFQPQYAAPQQFQHPAYESPSPHGAQPQYTQPSTSDGAYATPYSPTSAAQPNSGYSPVNSPIVPHSPVGMTSPIPYSPHLQNQQAQPQNTGVAANSPFPAADFAPPSRPFPVPGQAPSPSQQHSLANFHPSAQSSPVAHRPMPPASGASNPALQAAVSAPPPTPFSTPFEEVSQTDHASSHIAQGTPKQQGLPPRPKIPIGARPLPKGPSNPPQHASSAPLIRSLPMVTLPPLGAPPPPTGLPAMSPAFAAPPSNSDFSSPFSTLPPAHDSDTATPPLNAAPIRSESLGNWSAEQLPAVQQQQQQVAPGTLPSSSELGNWSAQQGSFPQEEQQPLQYLPQEASSAPVSPAQSPAFARTAISVKRTRSTHISIGQADRGQYQLPPEDLSMLPAAQAPRASPFHQQNSDSGDPFFAQVTFQPASQTPAAPLQPAFPAQHMVTPVQQHQVLPALQAQPQQSPAGSPVLSRPSPAGPRSFPVPPSKSSSVASLPTAPHAPHQPMAYPPPALNQAPQYGGMSPAPHQAPLAAPAPAPGYPPQAAYGQAPGSSYQSPVGGYPTPALPPGMAPPSPSPAPLHYSASAPLLRNSMGPVGSPVAIRTVDVQELATPVYGAPAPILGSSPNIATRRNGLVNFANALIATRPPNYWRYLIPDPRIIDLYSHTRDLFKGPIVGEPCVLSREHFALLPLYVPPHVTTCTGGILFGAGKVWKTGGSGGHSNLADSVGTILDAADGSLDGQIDIDIDIDVEIDFDGDFDIDVDFDFGGLDFSFDF